MRIQRPGVTVAVAVLVLATVFPALGRWPWRRDKNEEEQPAAVQRRAEPTYIDTLNRGREIVLTEQDFAAIASDEQARSAQQPPGRKDDKDGFRVQCTASSTIEAVRAEKREFEKKLSYSTYIVYAEPYYKLHVGDFVARADAEAAVAAIRQAGYKQAWIVRTPVRGADQ